MKRVSLLLFVAAVCLSAVSAAFAQLPTGTVAYWGFNNALTDGSANGNTLKGTSGTVAYGAAKFGNNSLYLNGSSTLSTLSGSFPTGVPTGANAYTVAAWIKADTGCSLVGGWIGYGNNSTSQGNNFRLNGANNSVWEYWYYNDFAATLASGNFFDGWHSVVGTWDGTAEKMYLDGVATTRSPNPTGLNVGTNMFIVGKTTNDANFKGWIDDLLILNRAMSAAEVATYQASGAISGPTFTITASAGAGGVISPSGAVVVGQGSNQAFTITPNAGYAISQVTVDSVSQGAIATYTFANVQAAHTIAAAFVALPTYTITATAGANGSISPSGAVSVYQGANQTFTITPNTGYAVLQVTTDSVNRGSITTYTFTNVQATHTISATFVALPIYTITASAGANGTISPTGSVSVIQGNNQTFTITPNTGCAVSQVTVDSVNQGAISSYTFSNVVANHTISATFVVLPAYTITASAGANGTISPSGALTVYQGSNKTFAITPNSGYAVSQVTVDAVNKGAITTYTFSNVTANHTISATFAVVPTAAVSGTVSIGGFATENATVSVYTDAACTLLKTTANTDPSGSYSVVVPQSATYYLKATQSGFAPSAARTVVVGTSAMTGQDLVITYRRYEAEDPANTFVHMVHPITGESYPLASGGLAVGKDTPDADGYITITVTAASAGTYSLIVGIAHYTERTTRVKVNGVELSGSPFVGTNTGYAGPANSGTFTASVVLNAGANTIAIGENTGQWGPHWDYIDVNAPFYAINASAEAGYSIAPSGKVIVAPGGSQAFTISAGGYVYVDGVNKTADKVGNTYTLSDAKSDHTISVGPLYVTVSGTVRDTYGALLAGVVVSGGGASFTTGADGNYTLTYRQGAAVTITAVKADYIVTSPSGGSYSITIGSVPLTGKDFTMVHTKTIKGVVKNAGGTGIYNAIVQVGGTSGAIAITDKDGKYEISGIPTAAGTEVYADALGYADNTQTVNTTPASTTTMEMDIVLTPKTEAGVIKNGGFESVSAGKPTDWTSDGPANISSTGAAGEFVSGVNGAKITPDDEAYSYLTQRIPVIAGSAYNLYWKMKGDAIPAPVQTPSFPYPSTNYDEPYRGQFHFSPQAGWMNDPNGLWYYKGTYYMTFQHYPHGLSWSTMHWGMTTSTDMMHWVQKPIALEPGVNVPGDCFSGSVVVDTANTSGFQTGSNAVFVAIYTATSIGTCLAYSNDLGATWQAYSGNPVAIGGGGAGTRDPHVFWNAPTNKWVCAEYENGITFYTSSNLKTWTQVSNYSSFGFECPDIYELAVDDGATKKWVLQDASDNYLVGTFNGTTFTPDAGGPWRMDVGPNFYASQTFHRKTFPDNRVIQMAWMTGNLGTSPWTHEASFPCEIKLKTFPEGVRVTRTPIAEISKLYDSSMHWNAQTISSSTALLSSIRSKCFDLTAEFDLTGTTATAINLVLPGKTVTYSITGQTLLGSTLVPINNKVKIRLLVDWGELEVYGNDGKLSWTENVKFTPDDSSIGLSVNGNINLVSMDFHAIKRTWLNNTGGAAGIFQHVTFIDSQETNPDLAIKSEIYSDLASSAPTEWTQFLPNLGTQKTRFTIPAGADTMQVQLGVTDFFSSGKSLYFDDVVVDRVGPTPQVTITASAGAGGSIDPSGAVSVSYGSSQTFNITPNFPYAVADVTVDGSSVGAVTSYTFSSVTANHTISATFAKPLGVNNRAVKNDSKLVGRAVKVWGKVKSIGEGTFQISDGYSVNVTIAGSTAGLNETKTVVVTGTVNADKSVTAQTIQVF